MLFDPIKNSSTPVSMAIITNILVFILLALVNIVMDANTLFFMVNYWGPHNTKISRKKTINPIKFNPLVLFLCFS